MLIRQYRKEKGMTVPELARLSGLPQRTLEDIERRNTCKVENLFRISIALDVPLNELCADDLATLRQSLDKDMGA